MIVQKRDLKLYALLGCLFWFFGMNFVLRELNADPLAVAVNYVLYISLSSLLVYYLIFQPGILKYYKLNRIYNGVVKIVVLYFIYAALQLIINPEADDFKYLLRNYSVVMPSFALSIFIGLFAIRGSIGVNGIVRWIISIMFLVVFYSEFASVNIGAGSAEDFRTEGVFAQANNYGYFLALLAIIITGSIAGHLKLFRYSYFSYGLLLLTLILILRTGSYGALLVAIASIFYLYFKSTKSITVTRLATSVFGVLFLGVALFFLSSQIQSSRVDALRASLLGNSQQENVTDVSTFDVRYFLLINGFNSFLEDPLFGKGISGRNILIPGELRPRPVHNVYVVELMKGGLVGFIIFALIYFRLWKLIRGIHYLPWKRLCYVLFFYMLFIDNTLTYSSFLSMNAGVIAVAIIFLVIFQDYKIQRAYQGSLN